MTEDQIRDGRATLLLRAPYYASLVCAFRLIPTLGMYAHTGSFIGVSKDLGLYYDPDFPCDFSHVQLAAIIEHEAGHILRDHASRRGEREPKRWNVAGDAEINDDSNLKTELPEQWRVLPQTLGAEEGKTAEFYYNVADNTNEPDCGSCVDGKRREYESDGDGAISAEELDVVRNQVAKDAKTFGNAPLSIRRWAEERLRVKPIPWDVILRHVISRTLGRTGYDYLSYPSHKEHPDLIFPRWRGYKPGVSVYIDTSGSISDADIAKALAVLKQIEKSAEVKLLCCDTEVHRVKRLTTDLVGGGGTDMGAAIRDAEKHHAAAAIIITDCQTPWPAHAPRFPVFVVTATATETIPTWIKKRIVIQ